jgi:hypothetical protein
VFVPRYALWAVPGFAIFVSALLCRATRGEVAVGLGLLGMLLAVTAFAEVRSLLERPQLRVGEEVRQALKSIPDGAEPIVVADASVFMELSYYGESRIRERLLYPVSRELEMRRFGFDTQSLLLVALSRHTKLHIISYDALVATQSRFVLAILPSERLPRLLTEAGYRVTPVGSTIAPVLYEVEATGKKM